MSDDDNVFFAELQSEFLTEAAFLLETYEESMLGLESGNNPQEDLAQIFRVAHSIKGGAAAVGLADLGKFAHVAEDLLSLLRVDPSLVNSEVISLLLQSGDQFKFRITSLQKGEELPWDTTELVKQLKFWIAKFNGKVDSEATASSEAVPSTPATAGSDLVNHELLAELAAQYGPGVFEDAATTPVAVESAKKISKEVGKETTKEASAKGTSKPGSASIKVDIGRVDSVLDAVGELVVLKNQLVHDDIVRSGEHLRLAGIVDQLDKMVRELYDKTLSIRMTPLKSLFLKIQRIVRDVSLQLGKPVDLQLLGEETEVERTVFELLGDPLVHLVRNAMDHGVEKPETRAEKGKPAIAKVVVSAKQTGGTVTIEIVDDGGGINRERVLQKAIERKLVPHGIDPNTLPDEQVFQFLFMPGFSTAEKVSDLSGRGVGLDVVKSNLEKINGKIDIKSKLGEGTTFRLSIPLSTAITDGIVVAVEGNKYILPIYSIREIVRAQPKDYTLISNAGKVVKIRERLMPVIDIKKTLGKINWENMKNMRYEVGSEKNTLRSRREETMLIVIESIYGMSALPVDDVIGQTQAVVKSLTTGQSIPEVAGAAILGDGRTVLILDPTALTQYRLSEAEAVA
jgi:two-component system chemotaxis sensor kinase CheA